MDLKNILEENEDIKNNPNVKVHKKPIQLKDIERRSRNSMLKKDTDLSETDINKIIDAEKGKIYNQTWTRLDNGSKLNRLLLYSEKCKEDYELSENEHKKLQKLLINAINKINLVKYLKLIMIKIMALLLILRF